jgi:hypothetical protein
MAKRPTKDEEMTDEQRAALAAGDIAGATDSVSQEDIDLDADARIGTETIENGKVVYPTPTASTRTQATPGTLPLRPGEVAESDKKK